MTDDAGVNAEAPAAAEVPTASVTDQWIDLFVVDEAPDDRPDMFAAAIGELERLLQTRPNATEETTAVLDRKFEGALEKGTWPAVTSALAHLCGVNAAYLLNWVVYQNTEARLAQLDGRASAEVGGFVRAIVARFWDELNAAQLSVGASVHDWSKIDKHVNYDHLTGAYQFVLRITKVNGEVVRLETSPDSLLNFATHLLVMIGAVGNREEFGAERAGSFFTQLVQVATLFTGPDEDAVDSEAGPPSADNGSGEDGGEGAARPG